jgi:hypothetical protein
MQPLAEQPTLDVELMWRATRRLLDELHGVLESDDAVDEALDVLVEVLGADRGLVLLTSSDGSTHVINARGKGRALSPEERAEVSRSVVQQAIDAGRCIVWDPLTAATTSASLTVLGIVSAFAAPLYRVQRNRPRGVLYVDFRARHKFVSERHVEFSLPRHCSSALYSMAMPERGAYATSCARPKATAPMRARSRRSTTCLRILRCA